MLHSIRVGLCMFAVALPACVADAPAPADSGTTQDDSGIDSGAVDSGGSVPDGLGCSSSSDCQSGCCYDLGGVCGPDKGQTPTATLCRCSTAADCAGHQTLISSCMADVAPVVCAKSPNNTLQKVCYCPKG